jgi:hypothetical protein
MKFDFNQTNSDKLEGSLNIKNAYVCKSETKQAVSYISFWIEGVVGRTYIDFEDIEEVKKLALDLLENYISEVKDAHSKAELTKTILDLIKNNEQ